MWNYVYYKAYLDYKDYTEFNGNESYIYEKLSKFDISWIPIKQYIIIFFKDLALFFFYKKIVL